MYCNNVICAIRTELLYNNPLQEEEDGVNRGRRKVEGKGRRKGTDCDFCYSPIELGNATMLGNRVLYLLRATDPLLELLWFRAWFREYFKCDVA